MPSVTTPQERAAYKAAQLPSRLAAAYAASSAAYRVAHGPDPSRRAAAAITRRRAEFVACYLEEMRQEQQEPECAPSAWAIQLVARSLGPAYC